LPACIARVQQRVAAWRAPRQHGEVGARRQVRQHENHRCACVHLKEHLFIVLARLHFYFLKLHERRPLAARLLLGRELIVVARILASVLLLRLVVSHCSLRVRAARTYVRSAQA
jgi:hypothetical protein